MEGYNKNIPHESNHNYFKAFIQTRGSVSMLKITGAGLVISLLDLMPFYVDAIAYGEKPWTSRLNILLFLIVIFMGTCFIFSLWDSFIYKHQNFVAVLYACFTILQAFSLAFMCLILVENSEGIIWKWENINNKVYIIIISGIYIGALIYNVIWLKRQLVNGFSEERTSKNYLASSVYGLNSLWIILGCTMFGAAFAGVGGKIFWYAAATLFVCAFSRLTVEASYAAYLRIKDNRYWEVPPIKPELTEKVRVSIRKKWYMRINVIICVGIIWWVAQLSEKQQVVQWQNNVGIIALLDLSVVMILWIIKKVHKGWKEKK